MFRFGKNGENVGNPAAGADRDQNGIADFRFEKAAGGDFGPGAARRVVEQEPVIGPATDQRGMEFLGRIRKFYS